MTGTWLKFPFASAVFSGCGDYLAIDVGARTGLVLVGEDGGDRQAAQALRGLGRRSPPSRRTRGPAPLRLASESGYSA